THHTPPNNTNLTPYHLHIPNLSDHKPLHLFTQQQFKTLSNPNTMSRTKRNHIINSLKAKNTTFTSFLTTLNPYILPNHATLLFTFKHPSTPIIHPTQLITYT
ncbi:hypothetical protein, partial [Staphylococcus hominis]|uniref:hypothetical protein n=1 Tax=Staphylococcus hominis TaxID=1290 RepID=UPI001C92DB1E